MNFKRAIGIMGLIFRDQEGRKPALTLVRDLAHWIILNRGGTLYFYFYGLQLRGRKVSDYLTVRQYNRIHDRLDPVYYRPMLEDKIIFDRYIKSFQVPSPPMLGIVDGGRVLWLDDNRYSGLESIASRKINAYCKQVTSWGGKGVFKINSENGTLLINNRPADLAALTAALGRGKYILQETILQHDELNRLNKSCVNTVRVYTIHDGDAPVIFGSAFRMGVNGSIVDNVSSQNMATGIKEDDFLMDEAHSGTNPPKWYRAHPDSGVVFKDFKLPFIRESYDLCRRTHRFFGDFFFIAWDVALTPEGPVILEGNPAADLLGLQILYGGQKKRFAEYAERYQRSRPVAS